MEGVILEAESGDYLGKHRGFWFYTIDQRQGLRLPGGPWYVLSWCLTRSLFATVLSANYVTKLLFCSEFGCYHTAKFCPLVGM
jgi:tRNA U34 2-thiouridine synthase MnmA/TrmU